MKPSHAHRYFLSNLGVEWAVLTLTPLPLLLITLTPALPVPLFVRLGVVFSSVLLNVFFAYFVNRKPVLGKILGFISLVLVYASAFPLIVTNPFYFLLGNIFFIGIIFMILDIKFSSMKGVRNIRANRSIVRAQWSAHTLTIILFIALLTRASFDRYTILVLTGSFLITQLGFMYWAYTVRIFRNIYLGFLLGGAGVVTVMLGTGYECFTFLALNMIASAVLFLDKTYETASGHWWDVLLSHPARILFTSFFILCMVGTILLLVPASSATGDISFIDAVFTSVSAVCVTGLIVLDTPNDFTMFGQGVILILIQLGGLGIMSITTIAIQSFGKRLSLKHEMVLTSMTDTDHRTLISSLSLILKYTFLLESIGFAILFLLFMLSGDTFQDALWRGLFTSVSAFCNAGFALQSDSLMGYAGNPLILNTVASLIFLGGMAPVIALAIPAWVRGGKAPLSAKLALSATMLLIISGTLLILVFEWNGTLSDLVFPDKVWNALFQSVTLRTAGFNSIDMAGVSAPAYIVMIIFMFIGGSPGGTAGGIKTTTVSVLMLTFWANITNRENILIDNVKISQSTINKAVTIVISGFIIWLIAVTMVEMTQAIPSRELIFEVTSAIGTVGLSTGATGMLDPIGKLIIIITMFAGRIGSITLFTFLSTKTHTSGTKYIESSVTLT